MRNGATTQLVVYQQTVKAEQDSLTLTTRTSSAREEQERMATAAEMVLLSATRDDLQQQLQLQLQQFAAFKIKAHESLEYVQKQGDVLRQAHGVAVMQLSATAATGVHSCNYKLYINVCIHLSICRYISLYIYLNRYIYTYIEKTDTEHGVGAVGNMYMFSCMYTPYGEQYSVASFFLLCCAYKCVC